MGGWTTRQLEANLLRRGGVLGGETPTHEAQELRALGRCTRLHENERRNALGVGTDARCEPQPSRSGHALMSVLGMSLISSK